MPSDSASIKFDTGTWIKIIGLLAIHAAAIVGYVVKEKIDTERRLLTLELSQARTVILLDKLEERFNERQAMHP